MDGCFDMMHYGHCNALRQARALGDQLVVGVVSDAEIIANKGPPVTPLEERLIMVNAVKWVDEVITDAPYAITEEFMKKLFDANKIDYIIHGDDPCSQFNHGHSHNVEDGASASATRISHFFPTSRRTVQFSNGRGPELPQESDNRSSFEKPVTLESVPFFAGMACSPVEPICSEQLATSASIVNHPENHASTDEACIGEKPSQGDCSGDQQVPPETVATCWRKLEQSKAVAVCKRQNQMQESGRTHLVSVGTTSVREQKCKASTIVNEFNQDRFEKMTAGIKELIDVR
ncbi:hypothetical protein K1719_012364 [Acacia pycnantha]|nr:hypothetical protein K1719_012364 [Acacia pycnantha]